MLAIVPSPCRWRYVLDEVKYRAFFLQPPQPQTLMRCKFPLSVAESVGAVAFVILGLATHIYSC